MQEKSPGSGQHLLVLLLLFITGCALGVTAWTLFFRERNYLPPDYAPIETEAHGEIMDTPREDTTQPSQQSVFMEYSDRITVSLEQNQVFLYFANPAGSNQDMVLQLAVQDTVLCQSGRLTVGMRVQVLDLAKGVAQRLRPGGYRGCLKVYFYNRETGEKAPVQSEIPVNITVVSQ